MNNLLKFEFRKLFRMKSFYILGACTAAAALFPVLTQILTGWLFGLSREYMSQTTGALDYIISGAAGTANIMILGLFTVLYVCTDYTENTLKNIAARGYSREQIFTAHYMVGAAAAGIYVLLSWAVSFAVSGILWGLGEGWSIDVLWELLLQLLVTGGFIAVFQFIATLIRKTGGAIAVCILLPMSATSILSIIDMLLQNVMQHEPPFQLASCTLTSLMDQVSAVGADSGALFGTLGGAIAYIAVFFAGGMLIARSQEI